MADTGRRGRCAYCRQVVPVELDGRLRAHVPAGLAARGLDGERCPGVLPRLAGVYRQLPQSA